MEYNALALWRFSLWIYWNFGVQRFGILEYNALALWRFSLWIFGVQRFSFVKYIGMLESNALVLEL
ncbi:MAG: hypothetical protein KAI83_02710 [Thiomargarita sp.]|nr:hypothetical protein [Thiomargarita sp.]